MTTPAGATTRVRQQPLLGRAAPSSDTPEIAQLVVDDGTAVRHVPHRSRDHPRTLCDDRPRRVTIEAKPEPLAIEPRETALIAVDMQNDFGADGGMFASKGLPIDAARATIKPTARVLAAARAAGITVVYLKMEFNRDLSNLGGPDAPNREKHLGFGVGAGDFLIEGTWNTDIVPELAPKPGDVLISKHRYSGFFETELDDVLRELEIKNLVFVGWTTSVCVESTVRDAFFRDYRCVVLSDCTAEVVGSDLDRTNHEASLLVIEGLFGWVADSESFVQALAPAAVETAVRRAPRRRPYRWRRFQCLGPIPEGPAGTR